MPAHKNERDMPICDADWADDPDFLKAKHMFGNRFEQFTDLPVSAQRTLINQKKGAILKRTEGNALRESLKNAPLRGNAGNTTRSPPRQTPIDFAREVRGNPQATRDSGRRDDPFRQQDRRRKASTDARAAPPASRPDTPRISGGRAPEGTPKRPNLGSLQGMARKKPCCDDDGFEGDADSYIEDFDDIEEILSNDEDDRGCFDSANDRSFSCDYDQANDSAPLEHARGRPHMRDDNRQRNSISMSSRNSSSLPPLVGSTTESDFGEFLEKGEESDESAIYGGPSVFKGRRESVTTASSKPCTGELRRRKVPNLPREAQREEEVWSPNLPKTALASEAPSQRSSRSQEEKRLVETQHTYFKFREVDDCKAAKHGYHNGHFALLSRKSAPPGQEKSKPNESGASNPFRTTYRNIPASNKPDPARVFHSPDDLVPHRRCRGCDDEDDCDVEGCEWWRQGFSSFHTHRPHDVGCTRHGKGCNKKHQAVCIHCKRKTGQAPLQLKPARTPLKGEHRCVNCDLFLAKYPNAPICLWVQQDPAAQPCIKRLGGVLQQRTPDPPLLQQRIPKHIQSRILDTDQWPSVDEIISFAKLTFEHFQRTFYNLNRKSQTFLSGNPPVPTLTYPVETRTFAKVQVSLPTSGQVDLAKLTTIASPAVARTAAGASHPK